MTARLLAALEYAKQGLKIFPCKPGRKEPAINKPFENATTDPDIIRGWFDRLGDVNIAYCPEDNGRCVADIDMKGGKDGMAAWRALPFEKPITYTVGTPTDGYHYHYLGSLRPSVGKLGPGIDTRGVRSLALLPPSITVDGEYIEIIPPDCIAPVPVELAELAKPRERAKLEAPDGLDLDQPWNVDLARDHLAHIHSKDGPWGMDDDPDTYQIAASIKDLGISEETAVDMMMEYLAEDERDWLATTVHNAYHYGQNAIGARAYPDPAKWLEGLPPQNPVAPGRFASKLPTEDAEEPPLEYWDDHRDKRILPRLPAACSIIVYGPRSSHKTGVVLKELVDAALTKGARVLYIAAEGAHGIKTARLPALMRHRGRPLSDLNDRWRTVSAAPDILDAQDMAELFMEYRDFKPNLIALDTGTRCIGMADINATAIGTAAIKALETLGKPWNATVLYVTHPGKDEERGAIGSKQQENQGYAVWRIEHDNGVIKLHVEKMKDGEDGFTVPMRVKLGGVPVVYEMSTEERDLLTKGGPTHDDLRDMVWREVYPIVAGGGKIAGTDRGDGPGFVAALVRDAHKIDATGTAIKKALEELVTRHQLQKGEGGGYVFGTAARAPETLQ